MVRGKAVGTGVRRPGVTTGCGLGDSVSVTSSVKTGIKNVYFLLWLGGLKGEGVL